VGLRLATWRCDDGVDLAGVVSAWWCKKHEVEAMVSFAFNSLKTLGVVCSVSQPPFGGLCGV